MVSESFEESNTKLFKEQRDYYKESLLKILRIAIKELPREMLITELKRRKIIEQDWIAKGNKFKERLR